MKIQKDQISDYNKKEIEGHNENFDFLANKLSKQGHNVNDIVSRLAKFQVAIPSWALGAGGTRFGRFGFYGEPSNLEQKIDDIGILQAPIIPRSKNKSVRLASLACSIKAFISSSGCCLKY